MLARSNPTGCQRLHIMAPVGLTQHYITRLFGLIPGFEYCDLNEQTGKVDLLLLFFKLNIHRSR